MARIGRPVGAMVLTLACACHRAPAEDGQDVAALRLSCVPVPQGLRCQLLALSRVVARAPRDVTAEAVWRIDGPAGTAISKTGILHVTQGGAIGILAEFRSQRTYAEAWVTPNGPGEMLGALRGYVYVEQNGTLQPLSHVRVEIVAGRNAGRWATTAADGSYALSRLRTGQGRIRINEPRYLTTEEVLDIRYGENHRSLLLSLETAPTQPGQAPAKTWTTL